MASGSLCKGVLCVVLGDRPCTLDPLIESRLLGEEDQRRAALLAVELILV